MEWSVGGFDGRIAISWRSTHHTIAPMTPTLQYSNTPFDRMHLEISTELSQVAGLLLRQGKQENGDLINYR